MDIRELYMIALALIVTVIGVFCIDMPGINGDSSTCVGEYLDFF